MYPVIIRHSPPGMEAHSMNFHGWFQDVDSLVYFIPCLNTQRIASYLLIVDLKKKAHHKSCIECVLNRVQPFLM